MQLNEFSMSGRHDFFSSLFQFSTHSEGAIRLIEENFPRAILEDKTGDNNDDDDNSTFSSIPDDDTNMLLSNVVAAVS